MGCELPGRPDPADRPVPADQVMDFGVLYRQNCSGCHGQDGKFGPAPPLNEKLFRAIVPEEELEAIVTKGRSQTLMPAFAQENGGTLTAAQVQVLVKEIKGVPYRIVEKLEPNSVKFEVVADANGVAPKWGTFETPPRDVPSYREPPPSSKGAGIGDKQKGGVVFARACASCHGDRGRGDKQGALRINDRVFLALMSNQALRRYAITGRADLHMPGFADARPGDPNYAPLTDAEVTDLVALMASWRGDQ